MDTQSDSRDFGDLCSDILLVEDSVIIAMDAEAMLTALGASRVVLTDGVIAAMCEIEKVRPTFAILDVKLEGETSFPIADMLQDLHVPYVFATGYSDGSLFPDRHKQVPCMTKPYDGETLKRVLEGFTSVDQFVIQSAQRSA